ncbi:acetyl-CoA carboxylase biotin carboxyl carrier protein [Aliterella atlantica]|uniref:Biotin carboxyl carrier protein of acetyl-CoA carboxylase n=1 Tax=Aliterella atlantica CENA595 TaxID=1618023 RepID=A0A0D8ZWB7_9CYAN|nr:acetyl-CoA carboxylase biotin carboxyl carrier protein [Aliterella atlantica]KJH73078.1 carboxylesterase [Aliterella atlantica CENA595]
MPLDFNEIRQLIVTISQTDIVELSLKSDDFELTVRKGISGGDRLVSESGANSSSIDVGLPASTTIPATTDIGRVNRQGDALTTPASNQAPANTPLDPKLLEVISPMVGTFYRAPAPGESAFVEVGDRIRLGQTVCIIEAMKLMNEIETEVSGQVVDILVENGEPVEYGQPLMRINPN